MIQNHALQDGFKWIEIFIDSHIMSKTRNNFASSHACFFHSLSIVYNCSKLIQASNQFYISLKTIFNALPQMIQNHALQDGFKWIEIFIDSHVQDKK